MVTEDIKAFREKLEGRYGIPLECTSVDSPAGQDIHVRPAGILPSEGFLVRITLGWRSIRAVFIAGSYAGPLLLEMGNATKDRKTTFVSIAQDLAGKGGQVTMQVNGQSVNPQDMDTWPEHWNGLAVQLYQSPVLLIDENREQALDGIIRYGGAFWAMILALIPFEETITETSGPVAGMPEGSLTRIEVNRYERSHLNRTACIAAKGVTCVVCGFNFEQFYGSIGSNFIHVHHTTMVSGMGEGYIVDPVRELEPVCPNCHAMLHRHDPPLSIGMLREIVERTKGERKS